MGCARLLALGLLGTVAACPPPEPLTATIPPVSTGKVRIRVFTEASPVRSLAAVGRFVFAGTDHDIERWDAAGAVVPLAAEHGLSGHEIVALASDPERRWVWVLTEGGLGYYDASKEVFRELPAPPATLAIDFAALAKTGAALAASSEGGAWIGTEQGLVFVSAKGGWSSTAIKDPIRALARSASGWLWMATPSGLVVRKPSGETTRIGALQGNAVAEPRLLVALPENRLLVIGADLEGHERLAIGLDSAWTTYRALPDTHWDAAAPRGAGADVLGGGRVFHLARPEPGRVRPLSRDGMRLVALSSVGPALEWEVEPLDAQPPPGAISIGSADDRLLIGTRDMGTARYRAGEVRPSDWLRRRQLVADATTLTVACASERDCWLATGGGPAWHWNGERFLPGGPTGPIPAVAAAPSTGAAAPTVPPTAGAPAEAQVVVAVVRDPGGMLYGLHRGAHESVLHVSRIEGPTWTPIETLQIAVPGETPDVAFARFAATDRLWLGLRYRDGMEMRSYGVAVVDFAALAVAYHRAGAQPDSTQAKVFPIPVGVVDAEVRGNTAWFATSEGIARLERGQVKLWTEADGLRSELARAVTIMADGTPIVATGDGAARWTGAAWDFPLALRFDINDVVATRNGQVWMATDRGIAAWDGEKVRRVDTRRGLAENTVLDVATDQFDRVWARGPGSVTLISQ